MLPLRHQVRGSRLLSSVHPPPARWFCGPSAHLPSSVHCPLPPLADVPSPPRGSSPSRGAPERGRWRGQAPGGRATCPHRVHTSGSCSSPAGLWPLLTQPWLQAGPPADACSCLDTETCTLVPAHVSLSAHRCCPKRPIPDSSGNSQIARAALVPCTPEGERKPGDLGKAQMGPCSPILDGVSVFTWLWPTV